ncbi:hypothetical protein NE237_029500 [Protea cynaroides]|uniref:Secreted protein n=1 Tax=Protea cynaroides TaxID=273540 RepID=A0A9Q0JWB4_9MAGN|nr:hypothetical protein NE237_029500 [Protea cynaroides]
MQAFVQVKALRFMLLHCVLSMFPPSIPSIRSSHGARLALFNNATFLKLSSSQNISGFRSILPNKLCTITWTRPNPPSFTIVSAKGYKMKTHKHPVNRSDYDNMIGNLAQCHT